MNEEVEKMMKENLEKYRIYFKQFNINEDKILLIYEWGFYDGLKQAENIFNSRGKKIE